MTCVPASNRATSRVWHPLSVLCSCVICGQSRVALAVTHPPANAETRETQLRSLGGEDSLGKEMATHSQYSCLENYTERRAWRATVHGVTKNWTQLSTHARTHTQSTVVQDLYFTSRMSQFSSVQSSRSVVSDSLRPHGLQHARPPCPSPTLGA